MCTHVCNIFFLNFTLRDSLHIGLMVLSCVPYLLRFLTYYVSTRIPHLKTKKVKKKKLHFSLCKCFFLFFLLCQLPSHNSLFFSFSIYLSNGGQASSKSYLLSTTLSFLWSFNTLLFFCSHNSQGFISLPPPFRFSQKNQSFYSGTCGFHRVREHCHTAYKFSNIWGFSKFQLCIQKYWIFVCCAMFLQLGYYMSVGCYVSWFF